MPKYLVLFNQEWVPELTDDDVEAARQRTGPLIAEMEAAGVLICAGGLDDSPAVSVDATTGTPVFTDGPYAETKEHLGGFTAIDVPDLDAARYWGGRIAVACGWPQEVRRFQ
ncbi:hypothetical protein F0U44_08260 [Nocardioides humilatus]|uniref:YCII-related domain-containing protein n=1 Tax=Nocardioides humilatus TaxID=2607660 RepID=A0A5B1LDH3_9ACTN|nr:YciI family protein [Nocardioides humilatus]KAA1418496.1 hypothetical protein F0U44_08260 [Nocardioides humilatus]